MRDKDKRILRIALVSLVCFAMLLPLMQASATAAVPKTPLDPTTIPKYVTNISSVPVYTPTKVMDPQTGKMTDYYTIIATQFKEQILPAGFPKTTVWGYGGIAQDAITGAPLGFVRNSPGPTIEATRGTPINVAFVNGIYTPYMFATDPTLDWTNPNNMATPGPAGNISAPPYPPGYAQAQYPVTIATHLHGGETAPQFDGGPYNWVSWNGLHGPDYNTYTRTLRNAQVFHYTNEQAPGTLWFHDHAVGLTRSNVYSGLAAFYMLRDPADQVAPLLPSGKYEVPVAIQDRNFYTDGSLMFPSDAPPNPSYHPYWVPEFFGSTIMVDGVTWPNVNVDQGQYLFKVLDGSNARWYNLSLSNGGTFTVIANEENYLKSAVNVTSFIIAPGERRDVLVDFTGAPAGTTVRLLNDARAPFPSGDNVTPGLNDQIMQFTVTGAPGSGFHPSQPLPAILNPTLTGAFPTLTSWSVERNLTLVEFEGPNGPLEVTIDGQKFTSPISELPHVGATEVWRLIDDTIDGHPIHFHLVNFQVVSRQAYNQTAYDAAWMALNGGQLPFANATKNVDLSQYLIGSPTPCPAIEQTWKDTVQVMPGEVLTLIVRFAPADGSGPFPFDVTVGPNYVYHCHIVDHEDQDMMRPYHLIP